MKVNTLRRHQTLRCITIENTLMLQEKEKIEAISIRSAKGEKAIRAPSPSINQSSTRTSFFVGALLGLDNKLIYNTQFKMDEKGKGSEKWGAAILNLSEMGANLDSLQKLLMKKAVFVDEETYAKASLSSQQARTIKVLEQRVEALERELDAAISAAARARSEKRQAEIAQRAAELRAQEVTEELENTSKVFELHMEELRAKQEEISKRDSDIKLLEAIIQTLGGKESR